MMMMKLEETTVNEGVFVEIRIHVREGEIVVGLQCAPSDRHTSPGFLFDRPRKI